MKELRSSTSDLRKDSLLTPQVVSLSKWKEERLNH